MISVILTVVYYAMVAIIYCTAIAYFCWCGSTYKGCLSGSRLLASREDRRSLIEEVEAQERWAKKSRILCSICALIMVAILISGVGQFAGDVSYVCRRIAIVFQIALLVSYFNYRRLKGAFIEFLSSFD